MIVTLAGHVDHGKTSLVRALSGVDTDRLLQEKQRGLTIDLGFAYIDNGQIGFVDVPGHQKFIHNMVAGVASNQHALMVIAADDGPMPQSKERLDILSLVGIRSGVIALTKADRVDEQRLLEVKQDIQQMVHGTFLQDAAIVPTSIEDPASMAPLLERLRDASRVHQLDVQEKPFRLAIDRVFTVKGAGIVVTGTVHSGRITVDDTLFHFPSGSAVRVRGIRTQDQPAGAAAAGDRCALNITGLDLNTIARGHWLGAESQPHFREATVRLEVIAEFPRAIKHWTPVHIYHATSHSTGRIALLDTRKAMSGGSSRVDLVCDEPLPFRQGDQLILRDQSLDLTLGGAFVCHAQTQHSDRRRSGTRLARLDCYSEISPESSLSRLAQAHVVDTQAFRAVWHLTESSMSALTEKLEMQRFGGLVCSKAYWLDQIRRAYKAVEQHQKANSSSPGLRENQIKALDPSLKQHVLNALVQANKLRNQGGLYQLPALEIELPADLEIVWKRLAPTLRVNQVPSTGDIAKQWGQPQQLIETQMKALTKRKLLVHLATHRFYLPEQLDKLALQVITLAAEKPFSVAEFRDSTGIGRNVAIEILEYFDRRGFTRRQGNARVVLRTKL